MNSETAILIALALGVIVVALTYGVLDGGLKNAGESLLGGENSEGLFGDQNIDQREFSDETLEDSATYTQDFRKGAV